LFFFLQEIAHSLTNDQTYVYQAIEHMKLTRNLLNIEYNISEIDDDCQAIDDEWSEFVNDFDDQKQAINKIENDIKKIDSELNRTHQWLRDQENAFQLMIASQPTLELKFDKLAQIKVRKKSFFFFRLIFFCFSKILIRNLESYVDLREELK